MRNVTSTIVALLVLIGLWSRVSSEVVVEQVTSPLTHSEGPHWDAEEQVLYYVDIAGQFVNRYDPSTGELTQAHFSQGPVTLVVPVADQPNTFVIGLDRDLAIITWDGKNNSAVTTDVIASVDQDKPQNRFNDGKADRSGRLWAGTMGQDGSLFSIAQNEPLRTQVTPVSISNGLTWNDDDTLMYYIDSTTHKVDALDFDIEQGEISNRRTIFDLEANNIYGIDPDGMTIDTNGNLWVALFGGSRVINVNPTTGELLTDVSIPADEVTSVAFGGPNLDELYVTTAHLNHWSEKAGSVFRVTGLGVKGYAGQPFVYST